jgi:hypothetical protein
MKTRFALALLIALTTIYSERAIAQQTKPPDELPKTEVGIEFTTLSSGDIETHAGVGARLTYNLNRHFAIEGAGYFSPGNCRSCTGELTGRITQGMVGVKVGQRFKKFGLFVKARPGVINLSGGAYDLVPTGSSQPFVTGSFQEPPFRFVTRFLFASIRGCSSNEWEVEPITATTLIRLRIFSGRLRSRFRVLWQAVSNSVAAWASGFDEILPHGGDDRVGELVRA